MQTFKTLTAAAADALAGLVILSAYFATAFTVIAFYA